MRPDLNIIPYTHALKHHMIPIKDVRALCISLKTTLNFNPERLPGEHQDSTSASSPFSHSWLRQTWPALCPAQPASHPAAPGPSPTLHWPRPSGLPAWPGLPRKKGQRFARVTQTL